MISLLKRALDGVVSAYLSKYSGPIRQTHPYYDWVNSELKLRFEALYDEGMKITGTRSSVWRKDRFFNHYSFLEFTKDTEGLIAECGVWKGLSAYLTCRSLEGRRPGFKGEGVHLFDSFEGLSKPTGLDGVVIADQGWYACDLDTVKRNLNRFPEITYHKGWIPESFTNLPEAKYAFVHLDLDLAEPTISSIKYFWERLSSGGIILCDDYASTAWKGTRKAVDDLCKTLGIHTFELSTGQLVLFKN